eukprot:scaffold15982_cov76-Skeletonema_marinoi.AAC.4
MMPFALPFGSCLMVSQMSPGRCVGWDVQVMDEAFIGSGDGGFLGAGGGRAADDGCGGGPQFFDVDVAVLEGGDAGCNGRLDAFPISIVGGGGVQDEELEVEEEPPEGGGIARGSL